MFIQLLINSIISAVLLSLVALGFNLIFNATKVFHLTHGAMYVSAIYILYILNDFLKNILSEEVSFWLSIILSLILNSILIASVEHLVYRPLYKKGVKSAISLISSLGVYLFIINLISFLFGTESITLNGNYEIFITNDYFKLTMIEFVQLVVSVMLIAAVALFSKTKFYTHIRAVTDSYTVAKKFGINIQQTRIISLIVGTILVGIAGMMKANEVAMDPNGGLTIVLTASVAVIVGGVNSLKGTVIACFVIALIENYSVKFLSAQWKDVLTYTLLIGVLVFYQQGLISNKRRIETR